MNFKLALSTATALGLLMGSAIAGSNNDSFVVQSGTNNQAQVTQTGNNNDAGSASIVIKQEDFRNKLTILQSGNGNTIGTAAGGTGSAGNGIFQKSNRDGVDGNSIDLKQVSNGNTIGAASQVSAGTNSNLQRNTIIVTQGDAGDVAGSGGNIINNIVQWRQSSRGNYAEISQTGSGNVLDRVSQVSPTSGGGNARNQINASMSGDQNGAGALSGAALASGATTSSLIQGDFTNRGAENLIDISLSGDRNQYGVTQYGTKNTVGTVSISGNDNQLGVYQSGDSNKLALSTIAGDGNLFGVRQIGASNLATVNVTQDRNGGANTFSVAVHSSLTAGLLEQVGNFNDVNLTVNGSDNVFASRQDSLTGGSSVNQNKITATQTGNDNEAAIRQVGNGNNSNVSQVGGDNTAIVTQLGATNLATVNQ